MAGSSSGACDLVRIKKLNGKEKLLRARHQYCQKKVYKNGATIWECVQRRREKCSGSITLQNNTVLSKKKHDCTPNFARNEIEEKLYKLKQTIIKPNAPGVPTAFNATIASLKNCGLDLVTQFPELTNVKSGIYNYRNASAGVTKLKTTAKEEIEIPPQFLPFLLAKYIDDSTYIYVFCSEIGRERMQELKAFFGDGTFKSCPTPFHQLYTIHGDLGSTAESLGIVPLIYALTTNRTEGMYVALFSMIKSRLPGWNPQSFKSDYEKAAVNGIKKVFENVVTSGCYFHYRQAVARRAKSLKLTTSKVLIRQADLSRVLPLLPADKIMSGWFYVASQSPDDEKSKKFRQYMLKQWIKEGFIEQWCVFGHEHRTTNFLEGWHYKLNQRVSQKQPNILKLLDALKEDADYYEVKPTRKRNINSIERSEFIQHVQMELSNGEITVGHFLEKVK